MATYLYETVPSREGEMPETFEVKQGMNEAPLTRHPETGVPVRRVITGGFGFMTGKGSPVPVPSPRPSGGCGSGCGCHH